MKTKCLIIDDEPLAIEVIESHLGHFEDIETVAKCNNAIEAFNIIKQKQVDLIFLDIQMPQITGIDFVKTLTNPPKVILTTAYREYAIEGYELDVVDYLLKPISLERFMKAVDKYYQIVKSDLFVFDTKSESQSDPFLYVKSERKIQKIFLNEITYIESLKDYIQINTKTKSVLTKNKISHFEEKLPQDKFVRIHKSFIVSLSKVNAFTANSIEMGKMDLPIGRSYKNNVLRALNYQDKTL